MILANFYSRQTDDEEHAYLRVQRVKGLVEVRRRPKFYGMLKAPRIADCSSPIRTAATQLSEFDKCLQRARVVDDFNNRASASTLRHQLSGFTVDPTVINSYSVAISAPLPYQLSGFTVDPAVIISYSVANSAFLPQAASYTAPLAIDQYIPPQLVLPMVNGCEDSMVEAMEFEWTPITAELTTVSSSQSAEPAIFLPASVPVSAPLFNFVDTTLDMEWEASPVEVVVVRATAPVQNQQPVIVSAPVQNTQSFNFNAASTETPAPPATILVANTVDAAVVSPVANTVTAAVVAALPRVVAACRKSKIASVATAAPVAVAPTIAAAVVTVPVVTAPPVPTYYRKPMTSVASSVPVEVAPSVTAVVPSVSCSTATTPCPVATYRKSMTSVATSVPVEVAPIVTAVAASARNTPVTPTLAVTTCHKKPMSSSPVVDAAGKSQAAIDEDEDAAQFALGTESSDSEDAFDKYLNGMGVESSDDEDDDTGAEIDWTDDEEEEDVSSSSAPAVAAGPSVVSSGPVVAGSGLIPGLSTTSVLPNGPATPRKIKAMRVRRG